jgi:hypothetical protein
MMPVVEWVDMAITALADIQAALVVMARQEDTSREDTVKADTKILQRRRVTRRRI